MDTIRDKERRKNINRIVKMPKEDDDTKCYGSKDKEISQQFFLPEDQRHKKRHSGMSREKKVCSKIYFPYDPRIDDKDTIGEGAEMC